MAKPPESYLVFRLWEADQPRSKKTKVIRVYNKRTMYQLGEIRWFANWRQYVFAPRPNTVFNKGCLSEIADYCEALMKEKRSDSKT